MSGSNSCVDVSERLSAEEALSHTFFDAFHNPPAEPVCEPMDDSFAIQEDTIGAWQERVFEFIHTPLPQSTSL